jgi:hypothetical protein
MSPETHDPEREPDTEAIGAAIQAAARTVQAPPQLRARIAEERLRSGRRAAGGAGRWAFRPPALAAGLAVAALAVTLVLSGLPGGGAGAPSVDDAVAVALARPTQAPPAVDGTNEAALRASVGGVAFPNYGWSLKQWRTTGARDDRVDGRATKTVVYRGPAGNVGYTIVDGKPLDEPDGAKIVNRNGLRLAVLKRGGTTVVTWRRGGHTCVLASKQAGADQLIRFATWS